jgi:cell shape-determining protein MreC
MSYLQNKKERNKKIYIITGIVVVGVLVLFYRTPVFGSIARGVHYIFSPLFNGVNNIDSRFETWREKSRTKRYLVAENTRLTEEVTRLTLEVQSVNEQQREIDTLRELLGKISIPKEVILADVIVRPGVSLYDTIIVDVGENMHIRQNAIVKAYGIIPIGYISDVYENSSRVTLYSAPGVRTDGIVEINNLWTTLVGRGGGGFEINLPQNVMFTEGMRIIAPGESHELLATAEKIISDPRDPGQTILLSSPVNINELTQVIIVK